MKKVILILIATIGLSAISCGSFGGKISNEKDSLAYALGIDIGNTIWNRFDSTLNPEMVCKGINDVFAKKTETMTGEEAQQYIQRYMTEIMPRIAAEKNEKLSVEFLAKAEKEAGVKKTASGLMYVIENEGAAEKVALNDTVTAHYTLYDASGKKLQSSKDGGQPMVYPNVEGAMLKGFTEGVAMLGEGGKATLYLPYDIAYGEQGGGMIGPKQALKFEVEVVKVVKPVAATPAK